jgi:hypothetical protein
MHANNSFELITGNTYPVKDQIKALGAKWDKVSKGWLVPAVAAAAARELVDNAPPAAPRPARWPDRYQSNYYRFSSGAEAYQNKRGRCEDAPCCGCCS